MDVAPPLTACLDPLNGRGECRFAVSFKGKHWNANADRSTQPVRQTVFACQIGKGTFLTLQDSDHGKSRASRPHCRLSASDHRDRDRLACSIKTRVEHAINHDGLCAVRFGHNRGINDAWSGQNLVNGRFNRSRAIRDLRIRHFAPMRCGQSGSAKTLRDDWRDDVDPAQNRIPLIRLLCRSA